MSRNSRHDVIATARRLFAQKGFHGTSMRDLGKELGLLGSSLYSHVGSKDELLVDVVREASVQFQSLADEVAAMAAPAPERLARLVEGHLEILIKDPDQARTFLDETRFLPDDDRVDAVALMDRYQAVFRDVVEAGQREGVFRVDLDVSLAANLTLSLLNGTSRWYSEDGGLSVPELAVEIQELLTRGVQS